MYMVTWRQIGPDNRSTYKHETFSLAHKAWERFNKLDADSSCINVCIWTRL